MASIDHVTIGATDVVTAERFYAALGVHDHVRVRASESSSSGFEGFTLSLVVPRPSDVDDVVAKGVAAGGEALKPAKKSLWGYGGVVRAPDGTICTIASSTKKDVGPPTGRIEDVVLQLGVTDVAASREFYAERGFTVTKSYGRKYVEFGTAPIQLTLLKREALAKAAGVSATGSGPARLVVTSDDGSFSDPDGFAWEGV
ncbi:glyoxalase [Aeromicrobium flavum]|nr:glyoxalase [Aeromicrobium flavum]